MFGISVYLNKDIGKEEKVYIEQAKQSGFTAVFTSLHIPEDDASQLRERLKALGKLTKKAGIELFADVSPSSLKRINTSFEQAEELAQWGITGLRTDYGIGAECVASLSRKMKIALNASTLTEKEFDQIIQSKAELKNVAAWHNYYPRPETGLGTGYIKEKNEWLHSLGLNVMAFVPGDQQKRGPIFKGLPTLEKHRTASPFVSALEFIHHLSADKVFIGDPDLSKAAFWQFRTYREGAFPLRATRFSDTADYAGIHTNRLDPARDCIRSVESRSFAQKKGMALKPKNTIERTKGSITIDNFHYLRYAGEMQITCRDLPADKKVNVVGAVIKEDLPILSFVGAGQKFLLDWSS